MSRNTRPALALTLLLVLTLFLALGSSAVAASDDLIISEYGEGASFNKYIEIYNGTGAAVDLAGYEIWRIANGGSWPEVTIPLSGSLGDGQTAVIHHPDADPLIAAAGDLTFSSSQIQHNGDDATGLVKAGVLIDVVGTDGPDPGSGWDVAGVTNATVDHVLVRKATVCAPTTDWDAARGTSPADSEWIVLANQDWSNIGAHTADCGNGGGGPAEPKLNEFSASTTGTDVEFVEIIGDPSTDYSAYTLLEIEGDSNSNMGVIDEVIPVGSTDGAGFWLGNLPANALENGTITLLLVKDFSGAAGADLDGTDDGAIDAPLWSAIADSVAVNDGGSGDLTYAAPVLGPNYDGVSSFAPGGASRIPDGADTESTADWVRNDFDLAGIPGYTGSLGPGEALNTPGAPNAVYVPPAEACGDPFTPVYTVQGSGAASPLDGTAVAIEGVVTADFQYGAGVDSGDLGGFYVQDPAGDGDPATSDGIFVFDGGTGVEVVPGDLVRVRGEVDEFFNMTEITNVAQVWVCGTGGSVAPAAATLPVAALDDFEPYEGMLITFPQDLVISEYFNFDRFGEIVLSTTRQDTPTAVVEPGPAASALYAEQALARILVDDGRTAQNPDPALHPNGSVFDLSNRFRGGDTIGGITGVLDFSFGSYRLQPVSGGAYTPANPRPAAPAVGGDVTVAAANVLNYFTTLDSGPDICGPDQNLECRGADNATELARQRVKIVAMLAGLDADVAGLIEIENTAGVAAEADLAAGLNALLGAGTYAYLDTGTIGTDAIKVALIYKPDVVTPVGTFAILDSSVDPTFNDDKNRPVLAQTFEENASGARFTVAVNHLKSKSSPCDDLGDPDLGEGAGNCNLTRLSAAQALATWLAGDPTGSGDDDFLIIGDLNSYDKEDPIDALLGAGYVDLLAAAAGENAYSYVFDGRVGYLDYALANAALAPQVAGTAVWHNNADEPDILDYDTSFKKDAQDALFEENAYRASDHDPLLVGLNLTPPNLAPVCAAAQPSLEVLWPANHKFVPVSILDVIDPEGGPLDVAVTGIFQDELVSGGKGSGNTAPDGMGVGSAVAELRAEREGGGNGRAYHVYFSATDDAGLTCDGEVLVYVPKNRNKFGPRIDDGPLYDSTQP